MQKTTVPWEPTAQVLPRRSFQIPNKVDDGAPLLSPRHPFVLQRSKLPDAPAAMTSPLNPGAKEDSAGADP
ncbi:MAG TPA: hypothetical protein PK493_04485, partial [Pseudomonadota bacterium]|nr:hypothetical protein [Pseudomonadota bacterium]